MRTSILLAGCVFSVFVFAKTIPVKLNSNQNCFTSLKTLDNGYKLSAFPNPFENLVNLQITTDKKFTDGELSILSLDGKEVFRDVLSVQGNTLLEIGMEEFESGIYFIDLKGGSRNSIGRLKIVKN